MRAVRLSKTYDDEFAKLLEQGLARFGAAIVRQKRDLVERTITEFLAAHPVRPIDPVLGICAYPVTKAPFVLLYDYDDDELRLHLIIHRHADRAAIDLASVIW
jgi:hypothetical protein